jgi:peptide/nickel transport system permease protein
MINQVQASDNVIAEVPPKKSEIRRALRVMLGRKVVLLGVLLLFIFIFIAIFAPFISPYDLTLNLVSLQPSSQPLGTDAFGRDTLSRLFYGQGFLDGRSGRCFWLHRHILLGLLADIFAAGPTMLL